MSIFKEKFNQQLVIRNYTPKTQSGYMLNLSQFLKHHKGRTPASLTIDDIHNYQFYLFKEREQAPSYINAQTGSIKFFCEKVLKKNWNFDLIPYMKVPKKLPYVHERETIEKILNFSRSPMVRCVFGIAYGSGARPFEIAKLLPGDIDLKEGTLFVRLGKGQKDRLTAFPLSFAEDFRKYLQSKEKLGSPWLFPGQNSSKPIDPESLSTIYRRVKYAMGLDDPSTFYTFRHSFATHSYENGVDLLTLQSIMGHASIEQTMKYIYLSKKRISKVVSPYDTLFK